MHFLELRALKVGVIVPAFQASESLSKVVAELIHVFPLDRIVVVDDGSTDDTAKTAENAGVICLSHPQNRGKGAALRSGLVHARESGWQWALTMDADGQHSPADVEHFMAHRPGKQTGILLGSRTRRGTPMPWHRRFSNSFSSYLVSRAAGRALGDAQCGFRAYRLDFLDHYPIEGRFEWESQVLILCCRRGGEVENISVRTVYSGESSHMRLGRDTWRFLRMLGRTAWTR